tara:strand:- start:49 stop:558 length:510 start_codon:yes stop_codon:yes gene_type:complete
MMLMTGTSNINLLEDIKAIAFDFDGVFTDNRVYVMQSGEEAVACDRSDGYGIAMLRKAGIPMVIISAETNCVVAVRAAKLKLEVLQGVDDKLSVLQKWADKHGLAMDQLAFIGNDLNDVDCLKKVGLGIVVADAYSAAVEASDIKLTRNGGRGAVREFAELILASKSTG